MDQDERKNIKIRASLHRRLRVFAVVSGQGVEHLVEGLLERGLTDLLAASGGAIAQQLEAMLAPEEPPPPPPAKKRPAPAKRR
jgi:hypothetical protein